MAIVKPTDYTAMKPIRLNGFLYVKGAPIAPAVMQQQHNANMLVSGGWVKAEPDPNRRRGPWRRRPTTVHNLLQKTGITREGTEMGKTVDDDEPRNTLTQTGMEATKEEREKAGEKFNQGVKDLKATGDPSDFVQERIRTTPEHRSELAADDDLYPEDTNDDASHPGVEPGTEGQFDDDDDDDGKGPHPTDAEKRAAEDRRVKENRPSSAPTTTVKPSGS